MNPDETHVRVLTSETTGDEPRHPKAGRLWPDTGRMPCSQQEGCEITGIQSECVASMHKPEQARLLNRHLVNIEFRLIFRCVFCGDD